MFEVNIKPRTSNLEPFIGAKKQKKAKGAKDIFLRAFPPLW
jgi:hypothetical protein